MHPVWGIYVPTYTYGYRLVCQYTAARPDAFRRLLSEPVTTADLLEAGAASNA
jgi:hypothetical protein